MAPNAGGDAEIVILSQYLTSLHCMLQSISVASAIHLSATNHGEFTTLQSLVSNQV